MEALSSQNKYKMNFWLVSLTFLGVFIYIIIRSFTVEPMLDELATFYNYIQTGHIKDEKAFVDANNHLLVSYVGWRLYSLFGNHFFLFRLLSFAAFPIYFYSIKFLAERFVQSRFNWLVLIAATTTPWIVEYFGFARGYGASLAFLFAGICFVVLFKAKRNGFYFFGLIVSFGLCISSNLSLLIPALLFIGYAGIIHLINWKTTRNRWTSIIALILFAKFFIFILAHIDKLKAAKALWWGSLDGLWEVTGKSLSRNIFFYEEIVLKYVLLGALLILVFFWVLAQRKMNLKDIIFSDKFWLPGVFIACLTSIVVLAEFFHINYPMDRVAMYLVPLFILVFGMLLGAQNYFKWLMIAFIWFPFSFCLKMNLQTSIFSPQDRITKQFLATLNKNVNENDAFSLDYVSHLSYAYSTWNHKSRVHLAIESTNDPTIEQGEFHISWINDYKWPGFKKIYEAPYSKNRLYKRMAPFKKSLVFDTLIQSLRSNEMFIPIASLDVSEKFSQARIQSEVEADVLLNESTLDFNLVNQIENNKKEARLSQRTRFEWYFGHRTNYSFNFPNYPMKIENSDSIYNVFFFNADYRKVHLRNVRVRFYAVFN